LAHGASDAGRFLALARARAQMASGGQSPQVSAASRGPIRRAIANVAVLSVAQTLRLPEDGEQSPNAARIVQEHELEVFAQSFPGWIACFAVLYCAMSPLAFGLFIWLAVSFAIEAQNSCDVPLRIWAIGVFISNAYDAVHVVLLRYACHFGTSSGNPLPWYLRLYACIMGLVDFGWLGIGIHWVRISRTCKATSPQLFFSSTVFAACSMVLGVIIGLNAVGLYTIMSFMLRHGMLSTKDAAPSGTLERLEVVKYDGTTAEFQQTPDCSICLAPFDNETEIRRTPHCGHVFHGQCLGNWLKVRRTCPLCRCDLVMLPHASDPVSGILSHVVGRPSQQP